MFLTPLISHLQSSDQIPFNSVTQSLFLLRISFSHIAILKRCSHITIYVGVCAILQCKQCKWCSGKQCKHFMDRCYRHLDLYSFPNKSTLASDIKSLARSVLARASTCLANCFQLGTPFDEHNGNNGFQLQRFIRVAPLPEVSQPDPHCFQKP